MRIGWTNLAAVVAAVGKRPRGQQRLPSLSQSDLLSGVDIATIFLTPGRFRAFLQTSGVISG